VEHAKSRMKVNLIDEERTKSVINAFFEVYNELGYGYVEHVYAKAMVLELTERGHSVDREVAVRIAYKGKCLCTQRMDMLIDQQLIIEIKSTYLLPPTAIRQLRNYLKGSRLQVGLLLHFGPTPKFYRQVLTNPSNRCSSVPDPPNPRDPRSNH